MSDNYKGQYLIAAADVMILKKRITQLETELASALASQAQQNGKCDECGKSQSDGFALYCVKCIDMISTKEKSKPESLLLGTTNQHKASSHLAIVPDCSTPLPPAPEGDKP